MKNTDFAIGIPKTIPDIVKTYSVWENTDFYSSRANLPFYPNVVPVPAFSAAFSRSFLLEVLAEYPIQTVIQLFRANKKAGHIHNRTSRAALAPLVLVLVCVCNRLSLF